MIAEPFRALDCSLINDGATAFLMTTRERARDLRRSPVLVAGVSSASYPTTQSSYFRQKSDYLRTQAVLTGESDLAHAGVRRADIDVAENYDGSTTYRILTLAAWAGPAGGT